MNIAQPQANFIIAKVCGCKDRGDERITYTFSDEIHSLCVDKKDILKSQLTACETLLASMEQNEKPLVSKELKELRVLLDVIST